MAEVTMEVLAECAARFGPRQSLLIRGAHGIGKSALAKMLGKTFECKVTDLRLSQMTEGDMLGLPKLYDYVYNDDGSIKEHGRTEFMPPDWFIEAQNEPVILLLDEINRATPELMQCAFQLIYDRAIQGKTLHPGTRIVACVNASHHYQVNEMDPALLNRFWTCDLIPTLKDWLKWAKNEGNIDGSIIEFCAQNKAHWWHNPKDGLNPNKVYPTPRGWDMLSAALTNKGHDGKTLFDDPGNVVFRHIACGLVGDEAGFAYHDFIKNYDRNIAAEDVLNNFVKRVRPMCKTGMSTEAVGTIIDKLVQHCSENEWTTRQVKNVAKFMKEVNNLEMVFTLWTRIGDIKDNDMADLNVRRIHFEGRDSIIKATGQNALGTE